MCCNKSNYREGRTDAALEMYSSLYAAGQVEHWSNKLPASMELDLHNFSRGMAYAAITNALFEVRTQTIICYYFTYFFSSV